MNYSVSYSTGKYFYQPFTNSPLVKGCIKLLFMFYISLGICCLGFVLSFVIACETHVLTPILSTCVNTSHGEKFLIGTQYHRSLFSVGIFSIIQLLLVSMSFSSLAFYIGVGYPVLAKCLDIVSEMAYVLPIFQKESVSLSLPII